MVDTCRYFGLINPVDGGNTAATTGGQMGSRSHGSTQGRCKAALSFPILQRVVMQLGADGSHPLAQSMHDASQLLPDGLLQVACLREMVQASYASQHRQEAQRLLGHNFSEVTQKVDCTI